MWTIDVMTPEAVVSAARLGATHAVMRQQTGATTTGDVQSQLAEVGGLMDACDAGVNGCSALPSSDVATWQGIYRAWGTFKDSVAPCVNGLSPSDSTPPTIACITIAGGLSWDGVIAKLATYRQQANAYMQRTHNSCPNFNPPPSPSPSGATCGWLDSILGRCSQSSGTSWPTAIKLVAVLGIVGVVAYLAGPLISALASAGAAHIAAGKPRGEFGA